VSSEVKRGAGGRSSFSGVVATVFGSTGFVGRYVVNRLGRAGSQVVVPLRGDEHDYRHLRLMGDLGQITPTEFNLREPESVRKAVQYSNVVINLIGRDYETWNFKYGQVHEEGARVVAEACRETGVQRLVHFSALNADTASPSRFLQSKARGEEAVKEAFPSATIIRPADIYGHEDRFLNFYASMRVFPFHLVPVLDRGNHTHKLPVYVGDVAQGVVNIISDPTTASQTYEFVGPHSFVLRDLVRYVFHVMYRQCVLVSPPRLAYRLVARTLELSPFVPYMTRDLMTRLHLSNEATPGVPRLEDVGVAPVALEEKALSVLRRYRNFLHYNRAVDELDTPHKS
jgi:uncharacterized protein YbjT (DUF2867 family)